MQDSHVNTILRQASKARSKWRQKRDRLFKKYKLDREVYSKGQFKSLPTDLLMTICYIDAFNCTVEWCREALI